MGKVLAIRGGALGDFVLTLPALRLLAEGLPQAELEVLGYEPMIELARVAGLARRVRPIEHSGLAPFFAPAAALDDSWMEWFGGFDVIFTWLHDPDDHFKTNLARCGVKTIFQGVHKVADDASCGHATEQLAGVCQRLGLWLEDPQPYLPALPVAREGIAVHPGSGSPRKNWPLEKWIEAGPGLAELLVPGERLAVFSGEAEEEWIGDLQSAWEGLPADFFRNLAVPELVAKLSRARAFLGHDSGVGHLAAALGVPVLSLFGPTDPAVWAPHGARVVRAPGGKVEALDPGTVIAELAGICRGDG